MEYIIHVSNNPYYEKGYYVSTYIFQGESFLATTREQSRAKKYKTYRNAERGKESLLNKLNIDEKYITIKEI